MGFEQDGYEAYIQLQPYLKGGRGKKNIPARCQIPTCDSIIEPGDLRVCLEQQEGREVTPQYFGEGCVDHSLYHLACFGELLGDQLHSGVVPEVLRQDLNQVDPGSSTKEK